MGMASLSCPKGWGRMVVGPGTNLRDYSIDCDTSPFFETYALITFIYDMLILLEFYGYKLYTG
jgi:hypothetical protein